MRALYVSSLRFFKVQPHRADAGIWSTARRLPSSSTQGTRHYAVYPQRVDMWKNKVHIIRGATSYAAELNTKNSTELDMYTKPALWPLQLSLIRALPRWPLQLVHNTIWKDEKRVIKWNTFFIINILYSVSLCLAQLHPANLKCNHQ